MECYSAIKMTEIMLFAATWMDLEIIILSEVSQTEKDKYCTKELRKQKQTKILKPNLWLPKGKCEGRGGIN